MSSISAPYTFSPNTTASSSQVNANFSTIYNDYNGNISATNLAADAVTTAKIADSNVTTAKINDSAVTTAKISNDAVTDDKMDYPRWWQEIGRTTLGSAGDTITVSSLPARKYLYIEISLVASGAITAQITFNGDTGNNYSNGSGTNGAAFSTSTSQANINSVASQSVPVYLTGEILNVATQEKVLGYGAVEISTAGAATAPAFRSGVGKWANTSAQISSITITNGGAGSYNTGSEVVVLGHD